MWKSMGQLLKYGWSVNRQVYWQYKNKGLIWDRLRSLPVLVSLFLQVPFLFGLITFLVDTPILVLNTFLITISLTTTRSRLTPSHRSNKWTPKGSLLPLTRSSDIYRRCYSHHVNYCLLSFDYRSKYRVPCPSVETPTGNCNLISGRTQDTWPTTEFNTD